MKNADIYQKVTESILANMATSDSWQQMWNTPWPVSLAGHLYRGINQLVLGFSKFKSPVWGSFKQIKDNGGTVKKGEKGTFVVFTKTLKESTPEGETKNIWLLRYYYIFNTDQCTWTEKGQKRIDHLSQNCNNQVTRFRTAEEIIANMPNRPEIVHSMSADPSYNPVSDKVKMPHPEQWKDMESYYCSLYHEVTHSTGHPSRLNRDLQSFSADQHAYSKEELIAELGAAFLNVISENPVSQDVNAAYINSWKRVLNNNNDWVIWAASRASKAVDYILGIKGDDLTVDAVSAEVEIVENPFY